MKKFSLLLSLCLVALMVPQRVWAEATTINASVPKITVESGVLTIESTAIEQLKDFMQSVSSENKSAMNTCTKIILKGHFNELDLQSIQGDSPAGFTSVTEVDMTDAQFEKAASSSNVYQLFHIPEDVTGTSNNMIVGGILYRWQKSRRWNTLPAWVEGVSINIPTEGANVKIYESTSLMNDEINTKTIGDYAKVLNSTNYKYLKMTIYGDSWTSLGISAPTSYSVVDWLEDELASKKYLYSDGQSIRLRKYYRKQLWQRYTGSEPVVGEHVHHYTYQNIESGDVYIYNGNNFATEGTGTPLNANMNQIANSGNPCKQGDYIWFYVYYKRENGEWVRIKENDNASSSPSFNRDITDHIYSDSEINSITPTNENEIIRLKWYFIRKAANDYSWEECYPKSSDLSGQIIYDGADVGATYGSLDGNIGTSGAYLYFNVYYTKNDTRSWTEETTSSPSGVDPADIEDANFDYAYRDDHKAGYRNGQWVKMPNYDYYRLDQEGTPEWKEVDYTDGSTYTLSQVKSNFNDLTNGGSIGEYAVVGGTVTTQSGNVPDYSMMSFKHWKNTLTTATTSKYANTSISREIFQDCKKLTNVNYLAGNVTGFLDHMISSGYNTTDNTNLTEPGLSVTIGKDVTQIDNDAFKRCDVLTSLTFDMNYKGYVDEDGNPTSGSYPKPLTIGDYAFQDCKNLMNVTIPNRVVSIGNSAFEHAGNKAQTQASDASTGTLVLTFERRSRTLDKNVSINFDQNLTIGDGCFNQCYNLKTLSLPIRLSSLGSGAFTDTKNLTSLTIREEKTEDARITTIPRDAFLRSGIKSVTIPRSVTEIQSGAFEECFDIETITFQKQSGITQEPLIIRSGAFAGGTESEYKLKNVYVEISPSDRLLVCEYNAFNFTSLVGQTNVGSNQEAVLNFKDEDWNYYQGDWKKGYAFSQSNLNLFKDGVNRMVSDNPTVDNNGLALTNDVKEPRNGWQQFALTTADVEIVIPQGNYIRTYSTRTPHYIPKITQTETYLYDIFRVSAFSDGWVEGEDVNSSEAAAAAARVATAKKLTDAIENRQFVPANTGLIMQIHGNSNDSYIVYQEDVPEDKKTAVYGYKTYPHTTTGDVNLLWPSCRDEEVSVTEGGATVKKVVINPTIPYPIGSTEPSDDKYRIFGLWVEDNAFWRSEPGVLINPDMAYLKLPTNIFHWANEQQGTSYSEDTGGGSRIALVFSDDDSETTSIGKLAVAKNSNDNCYTIQGVKLSRPQGKGLYIVNGKKVFVK